MVAQAGVIPSESYLKCACDNNPDGFGYAIHAGDKIVTGRGIHWGSVVDEYYKTLSKYPTSWSMFHARLATHGAITEANCHPFKVGNNPGLVIAHNGILPLTLPKKEKRSDTRYFAEVVLPRWAKKEGHISSLLDNKVNFKNLEGWAVGNKLAIFSTFGRLKKPVYIINESLGTWDDGIWWSNNSHKDVYRWVYSSAPLTCSAGLGEENWVCEVCKSFVSELAVDDGYCNNCDSCLDCCHPFDNGCMCYTPKNVSRDRDMFRNTWEYDLDLELEEQEQFNRSFS